MRRTAGSVYHNAYASTLGFNPVPDAAVRLEGTHLGRSARRHLGRLGLGLTIWPARDTVLGLTYCVVAFSILVQGLTIGWVPRKAIGQRQGGRLLESK